MSLISNVAAILDSKKPLDEVRYLERKVNYDDEISILDIDLKNIIPPPPKNSSLTTKKELETIYNATKSRTREEIELVRLVDHDPLDLFYKFIKKHNLKFDKDKFDAYYNILEQYIYALKYYHNRARPEQLAPYYNLNLDILYTDTHHTPAYPSGHTAYAELAAYILTGQYPEFKKEFFKLSNYCGLGRILQGVHYPSDNKASSEVVKKLYPLIEEKHEQYKKDQKFPSY